MKLALPLLVALTSTAALAEDQTGFYLGGQLGEARYQDSGALSGNAEVSKRFYAGYRFIENLGVELGHADFGVASRSFQTIGDTPGTYHYAAALDGYTLGVNGTLPLGDRWFLLGRGGVFAASETASMVGPEGFNRISDTDETEFYAGVGAGYKLANGLRFTAGVDRYEGKITAVEYVSTGIEYQF